jgi:hypothetical protein
MTRLGIIYFGLTSAATHQADTLAKTFRSLCTLCSCDEFDFRDDIARFLSGQRLQFAFLLLVVADGIWSRDKLVKRITILLSNLEFYKYE